MRLAEVVATLARVKYLGLPPAFVLHAARLWDKVIRWGVLFHPCRGIRRPNLFAAMMVGYLGNTILPARLGDELAAKEYGL